jgi:hypothetical protein
MVQAGSPFVASTGRELRGSPGDQAVGPYDIQLAMVLSLPWTCNPDLVGMPNRQAPAGEG